MLPDDSKKRIAFLVLLFLVPFLTELLSGNIPYPRFIDPAVFGYLVVMYGFPVLLVRELYIAKNLSLGGLVVLGLAYGVLNEGVAARTLLLSDEHMFMSLRGYETFGINLPWATMILPWHALFSIIYPIMLIHAVYPAVVHERWLSKRICIALAAAVVVLGSLSHFGTELYSATSPIYLPTFWILIIGFIVIALRMKDTASGTSKDNTSKTQRALPAFFFGVSLIGLMIIPLVLLEFGLPEVFQLITTTLLLVVAGRFYLRHFSASMITLVWIAFGHYLIFSLFAFFRLWPIGLVGSVVVWVILSVFWWTIRRNTTSAAGALPSLADSC